MMDLKIIQTLKDYFNELSEVTSVILYGSFAQGKQTPQSDIDLGLITTSSLSAELKIKIISDLALIFHKTIDVVDLKQTHVPLLQEILTKGLWLKLDLNSTKEKFIQKMIYEVADLQPLREKIQIQKIKRFINQ